MRRIVRPGAGDEIREHDGLSVGREVAQSYPVEPGQVALSSRIRRQPEDVESKSVARHQHTSVAGDIVYRQVAGDARDQALSTCERHRTKLFGLISHCRREPDLIPLTRERLLFAVAVDNHDPPAVVVLDRVIHKGDQVAFWRDARVTEIAARFVQHVAYRVFELIASVFPAHHREPGAVGRPVCLLHIFEDFARRAAGERDPRQRAAAAACAEIVRVEQDGHLTR